MKIILSTVVFIVLTPNAATGIDSYFFWGGTDDYNCYAEAHGSATGAPNIWLMLYGEGGLSTVVRQSPNFWTSNVTAFTDRYYTDGFWAPRFAGEVSTYDDEASVPTSRMEMDCTFPSGGTSPCGHIIRKNRAIADSSDECDNHSPILIDLIGNGFQFAPEGVGIYYDLYADGQPLFLQWLLVGGDEAFLVRDRNGNGTADNGSELFGNGTVMEITGELAPNGFVALGQFDDLSLGGNDDGFITNADSVWNELVLWLDMDADGQSTPSEMISLSEIGLSRFQTIPWAKNTVDDAGNLLRFWGWSFVDGSTNTKYEMVDVFFSEITR